MVPIRMPAVGVNSVGGRENNRGVTQITTFLGAEFVLVGKEAANMNTGAMGRAGEKVSRISGLQRAQAVLGWIRPLRCAAMVSGRATRLGLAAVLVGGIFRAAVTGMLLASMLAAAFPTGQPDATRSPDKPPRVPPAVEAVFQRRVQDLERALLRRDIGFVEPWLAADCVVAGSAGAAGRLVFREALAQLRQVQSLRLKSVRTATPPYRVAVELRAHGLASEREVAFNAILRFADIRLFQAEVRSGESGIRILVSWEPAAAGRCRLSWPGRYRRCR